MLMTTFYDGTSKVLDDKIPATDLSTVLTLTGQWGNTSWSHLVHRKRNYTFHHHLLVFEFSPIVMNVRSLKEAACVSVIQTSSKAPTYGLSLKIW